MMKERDRYLKIVEWSEGDKCYASVPGAGLAPVAMATAMKKSFMISAALLTTGLMSCASQQRHLKNPGINPVLLSAHLNF